MTTTPDSMILAIKKGSHVIKLKFRRIPDCPWNFRLTSTLRDFNHQRMLENLPNILPISAQYFRLIFIFLYECLIHFLSKWKSWRHDLTRTGRSFIKVRGNYLVCIGTRLQDSFSCLINLLFLHEITRERRRRQGEKVRHVNDLHKTFGEDIPSP